MAQNINKTQTILNLYLQITAYYIIGLIIFTISRITFLLEHTTLQNLAEHKKNFALLISNAGRFDLQAISYIALPMLVPALIIPFFWKNRTMKKFSGIMRIYFTFMLTLILFLSVAERFYFLNFNSRYNVVFFDFFDEGPLGLLQTMWQDYPSGKILILTIVTGLIINQIGKQIQKIDIKQHKWMQNKAICYSLPILIAGITFVFIRGSVTRYTLQVEHFVVSTDETINQSVPNALYLLKKAYKERKNSYKLTTPQQLLKENGYSDINELIQASGLKNTNEKETDIRTLLEKTLFSQTDSLHTDTPPNIIVILNESWSTFLNEMDRGDSLDILSTLRTHFKEDMVLKNFQSVRNGTIYSLETVTLSMPYLRFFNSRYHSRSYPTSIAYPFKENGYSTAFVTGMAPTWENVLDGLKYQYFDTIIGKQEILQDIPTSSANVIGVFDEFLYQYIFKRMNRNDEKPKFILALTTTNHPPFTYPDNMQLSPLTNLWYDSPMLTGNKEVLEKYGKGIQYANKSLGDFLDHFKKSPLADNTIVIVTGDHNVRTILNYSNGHVNTKYRHSVPLYIYLPKQYSFDETTKRKIEKRYGCHFDILPTIANIAFNKGTKYLNIGQNLFDINSKDSLFYSYNEKQMLSVNTANNDSLMKMMQARELLMKIYYQLNFAEK